MLRAYNGRRAIELAGGSNPDAVFIDRNLPDTSGEAVCRLLQEKQCVAPTAPVMLMTAGVASREERLAVLRAGAWDLITQPMDAEEILLKIDRLIRAKLESDRSAEAALIDAVTGLYSWEGVARRVRELAAAAERFGRPLACVVVAPQDADEDADSEQREYLLRIAGMLRDATRRSDVIGRIGPREFAILAPDTPPEGARILANRIRTSRDGNGHGHRAGVCAVEDLKAQGMDPLELIMQAAADSRVGGTNQVN